MYLHRLTIQAVGPFAGEHVVDFARLGASGLFLLEGPTGAGKSTLIDAIVFALYGKVASAQASESRIRSGHVGPEVETVVDLVLETGAGIFRVRRTPSYERPKKRAGGGTTKQQASVRLWRLASPEATDGELLSHRLDEAGDQLARIVGLDREQFVQTVVLPQGEFAGFLRANPEERRGLLQKVFGTQVYEDVQTRLERMRAEVRREVEDARDQVRQATAHLCGTLTLDPEASSELQVLAGELGEASGAEGGLLDRAGALVTEVAGRAGEAQGRARRSAGVCAGARTALDEAVRVEQLLVRRGRLRQQRESLDAAEPGHEEDVRRLERARAAAVLVPLVDRREDSARALEHAQDREAEARAAAPADLLAVEHEEDRAAVLAAERDACTSAIAGLERALALEAALPARRRAVADAADGLTRMRVTADEADARLAARPEGRATLERQLADALEAAAGLPAADERVEGAERRLRAAETAESLALRVVRAVRTRDAATDAAVAAVEAEAAVRRARIAGLSGELAEALVAGEPCTVCGSAEHPRPARRAEGHVTPEAVDAAEGARRAAEEAQQDAVRAVDRLEQEHRSALGAAEGLIVEDAKQLLLTALDVREAARTAGQRLETLRREVTAFDQETVSLERAARTAAEDLARAESALGALRTAVEQEEAEVARGRGSAERVADRVAELGRRSAGVSAWLTAHESARSAASRLAEDDARLAEALAASAFPDVAAVRAAVVADRELRALAAGVDRHRAERGRVTAALAEPDLADLAEDVVVDVASARALHSAAEAEAARDRDEAARLDALHRSGGSALELLRLAVDGSQAVRDRALPVMRMANLAAASSQDNSRGLTLASYVLTRRFEDVVAAANDRLLAMSSGRYALLRSEEKEETRGRRTGLAMKVVDHHTELERDPRTLSGGETFYVSLCLALGLADVVTAEAGGTDLGTLFIDEGFGSLDPETLDQVLVELGRLRDGGRVVGVVSHVEALKQAVPERLEVRPVAGGGSTLRLRA